MGANLRLSKLTLTGERRDVGESSRGVGGARPSRIRGSKLP